MPAVAPPVADEREGLLAYLAQQRLALRLSAHGLTDDQARATPTASPLSVGGLIKHVARAERVWMATVLGRDRSGRGEARGQLPTRAWRDPDGDTQLYEQAAGETDAIIAGIPDLGQAVPVPPGVPFAPGVTAWSVRWCCST